MKQIVMEARSIDMPIRLRINAAKVFNTKGIGLIISKALRIYKHRLYWFHLTGYYRIRDLKFGIWSLEFNESAIR